jgi:hypothetical protein
MDRPAVGNFAPDELLALRFYRNNIDENGQLTPAAIKPPAHSLNRLGLNGRPWFVLLPDPGLCPERARTRLCMGILTVAIKELPPKKQIEGHDYACRLEHDPLPYNFHHCEMRLYRNGDRVVANKKGRLGIGGTAETAAKKYYREALTEKVSVYLHAEAQSKDAD